MQGITSKIKRYEALGAYLYFNAATGDFSLNPEDLLITGDVTPSISEILPHIKPVSYTFCIEVSNACNLACDYCFNNGKNGKVLSIHQATRQLDELFKTFPNGEKYFVDLSGKGEPLLNIKTVLAVRRIAIRKATPFEKKYYRCLCATELCYPTVLLIFYKDTEYCLG